MSEDKIGFCLKVAVIHSLLLTRLNQTRLMNFNFQRFHICVLNQHCSHYFNYVGTKGKINFLFCIFYF